MRSLVALGETYDGEVVSIQTVSDQQEISKRFLEQILNDLRAGGFVESKRGVAGGYRLSRPMSEITVAEVIRHMDGGLWVSPGAGGKLRPLTPAANAQLAIRAVMKDVREVLVKALDRVTIADLYERTRELQVNGDVPDYAI